MQLDFGGYVKEYAADRVAELLRRRGARHGLVDLGGDLAIVGPHPDGAPWHVGDPRPVATAAARCATLAVYARRRRDERRLRALHGGGRRPLRAHPRPAHGLAGRRARLRHRAREPLPGRGHRLDDRDAARARRRGRVARRAWACPSCASTATAASRSAGSSRAPPDQGATRAAGPGRHLVAPVGHLAPHPLEQQVGVRAIPAGAAPGSASRSTSPRRACGGTARRGWECASGTACRPWPRAVRGTPTQPITASWSGVSRTVASSVRSRKVGPGGDVGSHRAHLDAELEHQRPLLGNRRCDPEVDAHVTALDGLAGAEGVAGGSRGVGHRHRNVVAREDVVLLAREQREPRPHQDARVHLAARPASARRSRAGSRSAAAERAAGSRSASGRPA